MGCWTLTVGEFLIMFDPKEINQAAFAYYSRLGRIKLYVEQEGTESLSLAQAARVAGMERKYFSTFFHRKVGVCFRDWLMWTRINEARRLMEKNNRSISDIAWESGFRDLRTFERAFKACTGITPREFRSGVRRRLALEP